MARLRLTLAVLALGALTGTRAQALETSDVRDTAGLFKDAGRVSRVRQQLRDVEARTGVATIVETVASVGSERPEEVARKNAERARVRGLYVLIDREDRKFEMAVTAPYNRSIPRAELQTIRDAFLQKFREGDYDAGLEAGAEQIRKSAAALGPGRPEASAPHTAAAPPATAAPAADLILRNQAKLTLAGARIVIAGAEARAAEMKLRVNVAVVDDGGHLLSFARMDGARPASGYTAITKATTAATFRQATGPLPAADGSPDPLLNLSLQNAAAASGGKVTTLLGGVPIEVDGQIIGAVGVGGGKGEQDAEIARAGIARYLEALGPATRESTPSQPKTGR